MRQVKEMNQKDGQLQLIGGGTKEKRMAKGRWRDITEVVEQWKRGKER